MPLLVKNCMNLILPPACAVCSERLPVKSAGCFCDRCKAGISPLVSPYCRSCGTEISGVGDYKPLCGECLRESPPYLLARSVVHYESQVQQLVQKLKYNNDLSVIPGLEELIASSCMDEFYDIDYIVAVPLHPIRLRQRGFNQALILARLFFPTKSALIKSDWLVRTRNTVPQTELGRLARKGNLKNAFKVRLSAAVQGATLCLVDDVFTTGTTLKECSKVLMASGALGVKVLTLARVQSPHRSR